MHQMPLAYMAVFRQVSLPGLPVRSLGFYRLGNHGPLKFKATGCLDVAQGRRQRVTALAILEEVATATAETTTRSSNATVSSRSIARTLNIPWQLYEQLNDNFKILKLYS